MLAPWPIGDKLTGRSDLCNNATQRSWLGDVQRDDSRNNGHGFTLVFGVTFCAQSVPAGIQLQLTPAKIGAGFDCL